MLNNIYTEFSLTILCIILMSIKTLGLTRNHIGQKKKKMLSWKYIKKKEKKQQLIWIKNITNIIYLAIFVWMEIFLMLQINAITSKLGA